jgi:hypothetical protein
VVGVEDGPGRGGDPLSAGSFGPPDGTTGRIASVATLSKSQMSVMGVLLGQPDVDHPEIHLPWVRALLHSIDIQPEADQLSPGGGEPPPPGLVICDLVCLRRLTASIGLPSARH